MCRSSVFETLACPGHRDPTGSEFFAQLSWGAAVRQAVTCPELTQQAGRGGGIRTWVPQCRSKTSSRGVGDGGRTEALRRDALSPGVEGFGGSRAQGAGVPRCHQPCLSVHPDIPQRETQHPLPRVRRALRGHTAALSTGIPLSPRAATRGPAQSEHTRLRRRRCRRDRAAPQALCSASSRRPRQTARPGSCRLRPNAFYCFR